MSVKISSLNTASTINSGDTIGVAGNNPFYFSDWGGGWYMQDGTWMRSYASKSLWMNAGLIGGDGGLTIGYGGASPSSGGAIIAGSVGIGTSNPGYKLDVVGDIRLQGNNQVYFDTTGDSASNYIGITNDYWTTIFCGRGNNSRIDLTNGSGILFSESGAERMRITSGGNVLIGTTTDVGSKLYVDGTIRTSGAFVGGGILEFTGGWSASPYNSSSWIKAASGTGLFLVNSSITKWAGFNPTSDFIINNADLYVSASTGNVGIGTTIPVASLDNQGGAGTYRQRSLTTMVTNTLSASGTQAKRFEIARVSIDYNDWNVLGTIEIELCERYYSRGLKKKYSVYYGYVSASGANLIEMSGSGDNQFQVTLGAEVVIGGDIRYIPIYVDVRYYSQVNAIVKTTRNLTTSNPPAQSDIWLNNNPTGVDIIDFIPDSTVYVGNIIGGNSTFSTGNVGIGTTNPRSVSGFTTLALNNATNGGLIDFNSNGTLVAQMYNTSAIFNIGSVTSIPFVLSTADTERMRITSAGNVGIGTSSPAYKLVVSNGGALGLEIDPSSNSGTQVEVLTYNRSAGAYKPLKFNSEDFGFITASTERLTIKNNGNVGIGTTSPTEKLHIKGSGINTQTISLESTISASNSYVILGSTSKSYITGLSTDFSNSYIIYDATASALRLAVTSAGNFGIGTSNPNQKLVINQGATGFNQGIPATSGTTQNGIFRLRPSVASYGETLDFGMNVADTYGWIQSTNADNLSVNYALSLNPNGGSVLVGTKVDAGYKLDVNGTARVSSNSNSYIVSPHAAGIDIYSTGNIAPHYQTTYTWYTGLIGAGTFRMGLDASGNLTAGSFIKSGGTSAQFLKADGSVDSNTYITSGSLSAYLPLAGGTMTGNITYSPGDATDWYIRGAANGAVLRLRYSGGTTNRSGALAWVDNSNNYSDVLTWVNDNLNATVPITSNSTISTSSNIISTGGYVSAGGIVLENNYIQATAASGGFWNTNHDVRFYPSAGNIWNITGNAFGLSSFGLNFLDKYGSSSTLKAQIFWSTSELGLKNDTNWVIKANQGGSYGGTLYGAWIVTGSITASANSSISGAVNSAWGLQVENTGTTNANGLYVNIGASSTGVPFRVDKGGAALFDITNAGNATIKGNLTISGATISLNSSAADIFQKYNNGSKTVGWNLTTANLFRLYDYTNDLVVLGFNATSQNLDIYSNTVTINRLTTSTATLIFNASTAGNIWQIEKSDANGLSFQKGGVQQFGINAAGQASFIGSLAVVGDYLSVGAYGLYSSTYTAYFRRNDVSSYGAWELVGAKGSYTGMFYNAPNLPHMMFDTTAGNGGLYYQTGSRWILYYNYTNNCLAVGGTTTNATYKMYVTGAIYATGAIVANSDGRNKENVEVVENALEKVTNLRGVTYTKKDQDSGKREMGVIAQEVEPHVPEVVHHSKDADIYGVSYGNFAGLFIEAIKEQQVLINELKAEIEILKNK